MTKMKYKAGDAIKLVIDNDTLLKYNSWYFKEYPRRRVPPIKSPLHPSVNVWVIMKRPAMNNLKARWKSFIMWFVEDMKLKDARIEHCTMEFTSFFKTKIRADCDNTTPKFLIDGFVIAGLIIDDDYLHLQAITLRCGYDKSNPRTEILITVL